EAAAHDARKTPVVERHVVLLAGLAAEAQSNAVTGDFDVSRAQRRQAKAAVVAAITLVADTQERAIEQAHHRSEKLAPRQARHGECRDRRNDCSAARRRRASRAASAPSHEPIHWRACACAARLRSLASLVRMTRTTMRRSLRRMFTDSAPSFPRWPNRKNWGTE